jgi:hypothetical protein
MIRGQHAYVSNAIETNDGIKTFYQLAVSSFNISNVSLQISIQEFLPNKMVHLLTVRKSLFCVPCLNIDVIRGSINLSVRMCVERAKSPQLNKL